MFYININKYIIVSISKERNLALWQKNWINDKSFWKYRKIENGIFIRNRINNNRIEYKDVRDG